MAELTALWRSRNLERSRATALAYYYAHPHPEEAKARTRKWQQEHPVGVRAATARHRARKLGNGGMHTAADVSAQYERQRGRCFWCKSKVGDTYHVDHIVPLAKGGSNGPENIVIACPKCNRTKHAKHPMDFAGVML